LRRSPLAEQKSYIASRLDKFAPKKSTCRTGADHKNTHSKYLSQKVSPIFAQAGGSI
jgi:hypothetical protein